MAHLSFVPFRAARTTLLLMAKPATERLSTVDHHRHCEWTDRRHGQSLPWSRGPASVVQLSGGVTSRKQRKSGDHCRCGRKCAGNCASWRDHVHNPTASECTAADGHTRSGNGASSSCSAGTNCATYTMLLPAGGPYLGAYSASGVTLSQVAPLATYVIDGLAFVPSSGGAVDCTPPRAAHPLISARCREGRHRHYYAPRLHAMSVGMQP